VVILIWHLADFICVAKCHLISVQHGLVKISYVTRKASPLLTRNEVVEANKAVAKVLNGKWCNECCKAFSSKWSIGINESIVRKLNI